MGRGLLLGALLGTSVLLLVAACTGDDPAPASPTNDAGCQGPSGCVDATSGTPDTGTTPDAGGSDACTAPCNGDLLWIRSFGSTNGETLTQTIVDGSGNIFIVAQAGAALGLGDNGGAPVVAGGVFVAKFDPNGQPLWAKTIGGVVQSPRIAAQNGGVFVAGTYFKNASLPAPITWDGVDTGLGQNAGPTGYDIFVLKIDASGTLVATTQIGGNGYDEMRSIGVDTDGSPILFGQMFTATGYRTVTLPASPFVLKLSAANFDPVWLHAIGATGASYARGTSIVPMAGGDIGVAGEYGGQVDWGDGRGATGSTSPPIPNDVFIARLKSGGTMPSSSAFVSIYGDVNGTPSLTNLQGAAYSALPEPAISVIGRFEGIVGLEGPFLQIGDAGGRDPGTYLARYDATTMKVLAFRGIFDNPTTATAKQVAADKDGNVSVVGSFKGSLDLGGGNLTSAGDFDGFVALYDSKLKTHFWSFRFGSSVIDHGLGVGADPSGAVVVTGEFQATADFPSGKQLVSKGGATNVFLMKLAR